MINKLGLSREEVNKLSSKELKNHVAKFVTLITPPENTFSLLYYELLVFKDVMSELEFEVYGKILGEGGVDTADFQQKFELVKQTPSIFKPIIEHTLKLSYYREFLQRNGVELQ